jgi:hypothetical protein
MESVFNKLEGEKIPEVLKTIKPAKFQKINYKNENENEDMKNKERENENNSNSNLSSLLTIEEIKKNCLKFLNKYKFLEYVESFNFNLLNIEGKKKKKIY